ncbi:MAG: sigma 54-interacting transcriptional regulator [Deltaproteobacteria bacterium]|nr:sigma 54-interacting transcriptional regulator [Deltaproteobacteria bacterium]
MNCSRFSTINISEQSELTAMYEVALAVSGSLDLRLALTEVLEVLVARLGLIRPTVTILSPDSEEVQVEVAHGLSPSAVRRGKYKKGEGATGSVLENGNPVIIRHTHENRLFLDRTGARRQNHDQDLSFICVPIKSERQVIGTLSADLAYVSDEHLEACQRLLTIVSSLIARTVIKLEEANREKEFLRRENDRLNSVLANKFSFNRIVGNSNRIKEVFHLINQVAASTATVLIRGESGTGKELVASALHYNSPRAKMPFIKVNCAALPPSLMESELFGHTKGSFTGAVKEKPGKFELAHRGTIFLDEIGSIDMDAQAKLLRVLQERELERIGDLKPRSVDVRVIAATNRNLEAAMESGSFREDLYFRLNVFPIFLPPLRERPTDILLLTDHFVEKYANLHGKDVRRPSSPAIDALLNHHWPGNVRELENCIERAVLLATDTIIHAYHLPPTLQANTPETPTPTGSLEEILNQTEKDLIAETLKTTKGNMAEAARLLKTTERIIRYKVGRHGINPKKYRRSPG